MTTAIQDTSNKAIRVVQIHCHLKGMWYMGQQHHHHSCLHQVGLVHPNLFQNSTITSYYIELTQYESESQYGSSVTVCPDLELDNSP